MLSTADVFLDRLAGRIDFSDHKGCWLWVGAKTSAGYGYMWMGRGMVLAHRAMWTAFVEPIPEGLTIDHLCRNRACVNPDHLEPVTHRENVLRGTGIAALNAVKTQCVNGHEYTPTNTIMSQGARKCKRCRRDYEARLRAKKRAAR